MKKTAILFFASLILNSCQSQEKIQHKGMSTEERLKYIETKINKFEKEPLYQIKVKTNNCYQILINDFPVYTHFDKASGKVGFNINTAILKSGKQNLEIRVFPSYKNKEEQNQYLSNDDFFSLEIEQTQWNKDGSLEKPKSILSYEKPEKDYSNSKVYIEKIIFQATVPYQLEGWTESKDLSKIKDIDDDVVAFYKKTIAAFENKEFDFFNTLYLKADTEWYQSEYFKKNTIEKYQNALYKNKFESLFVYPLKNYKISFYCDNKVIRLENLSGRNKGNSAFTYEYVNNSDMKVVEWNNLFLHIPKGKTELEIIR